MKNIFIPQDLFKCAKFKQQLFTLSIVFCFGVSFSSAQMVVNGANAKIVSVGAPHIVLNDISYKNEASSTHIVGSGLTLKFAGIGSAFSTISSTSGLITSPVNVTLDRTGGLLLQAPLEISNTLSLLNGNLDLSSYSLNMYASTIIGGSPSSYVKTSSTGVLNRTVDANSVTFPVGLSSYNPAIITNTGTVDDFNVRVVDNVTADGSGSGSTTTEAVVKRTWLIGESLSGGSNATIRLYWNGASEEINAFQSSSAFMAHYVNALSMWDNIGGTIGAGYVETAGNVSFSSFSISSSSVFAPLPIELVSFASSCKSDDTQITWRTASEHNSMSFIVESSTDGNVWNEVKTISAAGNSTSPLDYSIEHVGAARSIHYYRLIQIDQDGEEKIYGPIVSNCQSNQYSISTFPNPSNGEFTIVLNGIDVVGESTLNVLDGNGRTVRTVNLELQAGTNAFLVPDLEVAPGIYYIRIENEHAASVMLKHTVH